MMIAYALYILLLAFNKQAEALVTKLVVFCESNWCPGSACLLTGGKEDGEKKNLVNQMALSSSYTQPEGSKDKEKDSPLKASYTPLYEAGEDIAMQETSSKSDLKDEPPDDNDEKEHGSTEDKKGEFYTMVS